MLNKFKKIVLSSTIVASLPFFAFAQYTGGNNGLAQFMANSVTFINNVLVPFVFAVALLVFFYGVYLYFFYSRGEDEERKKGKDYMLWAIAAFVIMVSVWGIVNLVAGGLGLSKTDKIDGLIPTAQNLR